VWVFTENSGNASETGGVASHEAAHFFGVGHQSGVDDDGNVLEYRPGDGDVGPIMGFLYGNDRTLWARGLHYEGNGEFEVQDDMALLAEELGYRADDHGDGNAASAFVRSGNQLSGSGIIATTADRDGFSFTTFGGQVSLTVSTIAVGANLDAKAELWNYTDAEQPVLVASSDLGNSLNATITANLAMGKYVLVVASHGSYGDVGQYTVSGTAPAGPYAYLDAAGKLQIVGADDSSHGENVTVDLDNHGTPFNLGDDEVVVTINYNGQTGVARVKAFEHGEIFWVGHISQIVYRGYGGSDTFVNNTPFASLAYGGSGGDTLRGGSGVDEFYDNDGVTDFNDYDILVGNGGDDQLYASGGMDQLDGGAGNDTLYGGADGDSLLGGANDDTLHGNGGDDVLVGGDGNDTLYGWSGADRLDGGNGRDTLYAHGWEGSDVADNTTYALQELHGGEGNDTLYGSNSVDYLYGDAGKDTLLGRGGNDGLFGGEGNDTLYGGHGSDTLRGGGGNDLLFGGEIHEQVFGADQSVDYLYGDAGDDTLRGGYGNDILTGGEGRDRLFGEFGDDTLFGDAIDYELSGGAGDDTIYPPPFTLPRGGF
jgi:Ca2+-binding RTX toxin-like protein